jgi:hypothetical protein
MPNGASTTMPQKAEANETSSPDESPSFRWLYSVLTAYETDATTTASVPTAPAQPPCGWMPTSTPTPTMPRAMPTARDPVTRSPGMNRIASSTTKIGIDALAIAAMPESILVSPQAINQNGSAVLTMPRTMPARPKSRRHRNA